MDDQFEKALKTVTDEAQEVAGVAADAAGDVASKTEAAAQQAAGEVAGAALASASEVQQALAAEAGAALGSATTTAANAAATASAAASTAATAQVAALAAQQAAAQAGTQAAAQVATQVASQVATQAASQAANTAVNAAAGAAASAAGTNVAGLVSSAAGAATTAAALSGSVGGLVNTVAQGAQGLNSMTSLSDAGLAGLSGLANQELNTAALSSLVGLDSSEANNLLNQFAGSPQVAGNFADILPGAVDFSGFQGDLDLSSLGGLANMGSLGNLGNLNQLSQVAAAQLSRGDTQGAGQLIVNSVTPPNPPDRRMVSSAAATFLGNNGGVRLVNMWGGGGGTEEAAVDPQKKELEDMKIATLYNMRQDIKYQAADAQWSCPFLYLTSKQANQISRLKMPKIREVMGLDGQKMVIRLLPSYFGPMAGYTYPFDTTRFPCRDLGSVHHTLGENLTLLAKEVLLPLAIKTGALIVGTDSCELALAFLRVAAPVQRQLGDDCPFKVLFFLRAPQFDLMASTKGTNVWNFKDQCKAWKEASHKEACKRLYGEDEAFHPHGELVPGHYSVIMFECLSGGTISDEVGNSFQNDFISSLADTHPVIGLQTLGTHSMSVMPTVADHASRGMPLMLLDSHNRTGFRTAQEVTDSEMPIGERLRLCEQDLDGLAKEWQKEHRTDRHTTSMLAYVKSIFAQTQHSRAGVKSQKSMWIWQAIEKKRDEEASLSQANKLSQLNKAAKEDDPYLFATNMIMRQAGRNSAWEADYLRELCQETLQTILKEATTWHKFAEQLKKPKNWVGLRGICFFNYEALKEFTDEHNWCQVKPLETEGELGRQMMEIQADDAERNGVDLEHAKSLFRQLCESEIVLSEEYDKKNKSEEAFMNKRDVWLAAYDILKDNKNVQSASLWDLSGCEKKLFSLAQNIDRLPQENSLTALVLIRRAWTLVDLFTGNATFYKAVSKASYFLGLITGIAVIAVHTITVEFSEDITAEQEQYVLLGLALLMSAINGLTAAFEPAKKWMQLRGGGLALTKEIWKFRTRIGEYSISSGGLSSLSRVGAEREAEMAFQEFIHGIQEKVLQSSGLKDTNFFAISTCTDDVHQDLDEDEEVFEDDEEAHWSHSLREIRNERASKPPELGRSQNFWVRWMNIYHKHHQYQKHEKERHVDRYKSREDNHHSPATPHEYIRYSVMPAKQFYETRIPIYACRRRFFQVVALVTSLAAAFLAAMAWQQWTTIVATVGGSCAAWQEFTGLAKKLERYSTVVSSLDSILMWWQALPSVDQSIVQNVEALVERTESLLGSEHAAWLSDAQRNQRMNGPNQDKAAKQPAGATDSQAGVQSDQQTGAKS